MKRVMVGICYLSLLGVVVAWGTYEAPLDIRKASAATFTERPQVTRVDGGWRITFAASVWTDVEVAVLDAKGKVLRHVVGGLLGPNASAPLVPNSLKQELLWDGKDDRGETVVPGEARVRVRLGLQPRFEKHVGWDGQTLGPIRALTVGSKGEVYVIAAGWVGQGRVEIRVFGPDGKYRRTIMPYSAVTPLERAKSVGQLEIGGQRIPVVFNGHAHALSPLTPGLPRQNMAWNPQGYVVAVSTLATTYEHGLPRHLLAFHPQGGAPEGIPFVGPEIRPPTGLLWGHGEGDDPCFDHLAVSPDGKWIYYTQTTFYSPHCVFRLAWDEEYGSGMEVGWFGEQNRPGSDDRHLNGPEGLAVDRQGRVYVCDRGNNRVVVISPDGIMLGRFAVDYPEQIAVHPRSGEIYIFCREAPPGDPPKDIGPISMEEYRAWKARQVARRARRSPAKPTRLLKFSAWDEKPVRQLAALDVEIDLMALDPEATPPRLWASIKNRLVPITDKGDNFEIGNPVDGGVGLLYPAYVAGDPERNRILLYQYSSNFKIYSLDIATGTKRLFLEGLSDFAIAPDGSIYGTGKYGRNELLRFAPDGSPLPFGGMNTNVVKIGSLWVGGVNLGARGITVSPAGDIYLMRAANERGVQSRVDVYGPDGKLKKAALVDGLGIGDCGIGVDAAGNIYLGVNVKPKERMYPDEFKGKIPESNWLCWAQWDWHYRPAPWKYSMRNEYLYHWGAVMKFGPSGGAFYGRGQKSYEVRCNSAQVALVENAPPGAAEYLSGYLYHPIKVVGAQWRYPGMGIVPSSERLWGDPSCVCLGSRLAVDGYGRVFLPNCFLFCVEVIDNAANRITRIGRYGNPDDQGSDPFFAWPAFVSVSGDKLFVADSVNRRVTVLSLSYAAEAMCQVSQ